MGMHNLQQPRFVENVMVDWGKKRESFSLQEFSEVCGENVAIEPEAECEISRIYLDLLLVDDRADQACLV